MQITARRFDFRNLALFHGWAFLSPFIWDDSVGALTRPLRVGRERAVRVCLRARRKAGKTLVLARIDGERSLTPAARKAVRRQVRRMLCLDQDFTEFHAVCRGDPVLGFVSLTKAGGLLRAPCAFEDLVKTVCTTNCDWRNTRRMCERLCALEGGAFPTPRTLLRYSAAELAERVPLGYRAETVRTVARLFAEGRLPLDRWGAAGDFDRIREALGSVRGVGPYSVNHMLVLLGWYGDIPVDSEVLRYLRNADFEGRAVPVRHAVERFERYGRWKFLAYKFERMARRMNYIDK